MGIVRATATMMLREARRRPFAGNVATLGRQHIHFTYETLQRIASGTGVDLKPTDITLHREPSLAEQGFISDETYFRALGFQSVIRIDVSDYEAPDRLIDLNSGSTPEDLWNRFDMVLDTGTAEHVFHLPHLLQHMHRLAKVGGRVLHMSPSSNHLDHGFYMFSPTLFWDYYHANRYEINAFKLCRYTGPTTQAVWRVFDYRPERVRGAARWGALDRAMYEVHCVATKTEQSTSGIPPQQGSYVERWEQASGGPPQEDGKAGKLLRRTAGSPLINAGAKQLIRTWRKMRSSVESRLTHTGLHEESPTL